MCGMGGGQGGGRGRRFLEETDLCLLGEESGDGVVENCPCGPKTSCKSGGP